MVKRIGIFIDIPDGKRSRIKAKEHLSCLETLSDLKQKLQEAKAEAEFYKFRCEIKEEELDDLRRSEKQKVEEAKADTEFYKFRCAMKDEELDELRQSENQKLEEAKADTEYYKFKCDMKDEELDELRRSENQKVEEAKADTEYYKFKCDMKDEELNELQQSEKQKVEEVKADTEYYKFKCDMKDEELDELRQREKELLDELKRAKTRTKLHQRLIEELQLLLDEDEPTRHGPAAGGLLKRHLAIGMRLHVALKPGTRQPCAVVAVTKRLAWWCSHATISASAWRANWRPTGVPIVAP